MANESLIDELPWSADALDRLHELVAARDYLDWLIERAVIECRTNAVHINGVEYNELHDANQELRSYEPFSWAKIAQQLGVTRQVAWRKYAHLTEGREQRFARRAHPRSFAATRPRKSA